MTSEPQFARSPADQPFVIATRGSALALAQANLTLAHCLSAFPHREFQLRVVKTTGDKLQAESSAEVNLPKGLFTKELETALLGGEADFAVHSLKDLPTELPPGLVLGAITKRVDVRDVLIYRQDALGDIAVSPGSIAELPAGLVVATSSPRRGAQLLDRNSRLNVVPIRGNVPTRLCKLGGPSDFGALVLAAAGLHRLGYSIGADGTLSGSDVPEGLRAFIISLDDMLPCVGQGALGIEIREGDERAREVCAVLNDPATKPCALAERAFLRAMGGGCQTPVAAYAELLDDTLRLRAVSFETGQAQRADLTGDKTSLESLARAAAAQLTRSK